MKERIKKISKIAFVVILAIVILYNVVFHTVTMSKEEKAKIEGKYNEFVLFYFSPPIRYLKKIFPPAEIVHNMYLYYIKLPLDKDMWFDESDINVVFFRWKASELKEQVKREIIRDLEEFKQSGYIHDYSYDDEIMLLDIFIDTVDIDMCREACDYIEDKWQKDKLATLGALREIRGRDGYVKIHEVGSN